MNIKVVLKIFYNSFLYFNLGIYDSFFKKGMFGWVYGFKIFGKNK